MNLGFALIFIEIMILCISLRFQGISVTSLPSYIVIRVKIINNNSWVDVSFIFFSVILTEACFTFAGQDVSQEQRSPRLVRSPVCNVPSPLCTCSPGHVY